ncbi:MAG: GIY-YIG nuclease family protein [Geobacter sp.]|nr:GIY-YIG nuclease family protein [Geobacter sp.]
MCGRFTSPHYDWCVYVIRCSDGSLYTGITTDIARRFQQHAAGTGAKYFRGRSPEQVVYLEQQHTRSTASARERQIKAMHRAAKDELVLTQHNR